MAVQPDAAAGPCPTRSGPTRSGPTRSGPTGSSLPGTSPVVGATQRQAWLENLLPPVEQVRPGLWSIPVPWPRSALRYTLAYLLTGPTGPALIDTGWPAEHAWTALADGIRQTGHDIGEVRCVLVTHAHSDHLGLAGQVRQASGAWIGMHPAETATLRPAQGWDWQQSMADWLRSRGAPGDQLAEITALMAGAAEHHARLARPDFEIEHESRPLGAASALRAVWTPGHTPGHLCFYDEHREILMTGDHVLPRITPHIGLQPGGEGDPLGDYQASLRALARYRTAEVLPAHEYRFADLGARIEAMLGHHRTRLAEIEHAVACDPGLSTWAVAEALTWSRGWEHTRGIIRQNAVSETWAHLVHLRARHRVVDQGQGVDSWLPGPRCSAADC
jgi:glyoxylase-like metal-dependent hydrolase (beta-lactamase superfamily II)